jgi:hypothetical protein
MSKKYLGRTAILGTPLRTKEIEVPEWGGALLIVEQSIATAMIIAGFPNDMPDDEKTARWFILHVVDKDGNLLFSADDIPALVEKSFDVLNDVVSEIIAFSSAKKKARREATAESEQSSE